MRKIGKRAEYIEAVKDEFGLATLDELINQIAHCWRKEDLLFNRLCRMRDDYYKADRRAAIAGA